MRRERGATTDTPVAPRRRVEFTGCVEQREQLVNLKKRPRWLGGRKKPLLAFADLERVALDVAIVLGPLQDLAEKREDGVDRG